MAKVVWPTKVLRSLISIEAYIARDDPNAATRLGGRVFAAGESLAIFPNRGRPAGNGVRQLATVSPYIIRYRVHGDTVTILSIRHGARRPLD